MQKTKLVLASGTVCFFVLPTLADVLYDNGPFNGVNGYSYATSGVFGFRRTLLDDFVVPEGGWTLQEMHWNAVGCPPFVGCNEVGAEIAIRSDMDGTPGPTIHVANLTAFSFSLTGNIYFSRREFTSWATFSDIALPAGHYWFEAAGQSAHINFWLTADQNYNECWVNYEDHGGFGPGTDQFGVASDINFILGGVPGPTPLALLSVAGLGTRRRRM